MLVYSPLYNTDLNDYGIKKPFALDRGQMVLNKLAEISRQPIKYVSPSVISLDDLRLVHTNEYLQSLADPVVWQSIFELKPDEYFPETAKYPLNALFDDIRLKCGGTMLAAELALKHGLAANLGGGYHHAFPNEGRGFCVLNDIAVAIKSLQARQLCQNVLIVDLDFHQGDGTALIFSGDDNVFTLSVHSEEGWPEEKQKSKLDVPIYANEENQYLDKVKAAVTKALAQFSPDLVIYIAGSDPYELDVLPGTKFIKLSLAQMRERDEFVIDTFADCKIPLAMVFAGGYGPHVWEVHYFATKQLLERSSLGQPTKE